MKRLLLLATLLIGALAFSNDYDNYQYPIENPLLATLTSAAVAPRDYDVETLRLEFKPERARVPTLEKRHYLEVTYKLQPGKAPLVFIVPGLGGLAGSNTSLLLSQQMFELGYHAVTLPSPFSLAFVVGGSRSGLVGYGPTDAADLYEVMKFAIAHLEKEEDLRSSAYGLAGYSLGGLDVGFLLQLDRREQHFGFQRALMINPPIDLAYGMSVLDRFFSQGLKMPEAYRGYIFGYMMDFMQHSAQRSLDQILKDYKLKDPENRWLIGMTYRTSLTDVILASQQVNDLGILKSSAATGSRMQEAQRLSFVDYFEKIFFPTTGAKELDDFLVSGSLLGLQDLLRNDPAAFVIHSADDFLLRPEDPALLEEMMGNRLLMFPRGGHFGNIWFIQNIVETKRIMSGMQ
jgi:hypothetical protein